jgi:hypothetical protein
MSDRDTRSLVLRFWDLASSQRREIALELGLLEKEEIAAHSSLLNRLVITREPYLAVTHRRQNIPI